MRVRTILFDLGGTLLVMRRDRVFQLLLKESGFDAPIDSIHRAYCLLDPWWLEKTSGSSPGSDPEGLYLELYSRLLDKSVPGLSRDMITSISKQGKERWEDLEKDVPFSLYPDTEPTLKELSARGFTLGLVSNAPPQTIDVVRDLGLHSYLSHIVISGTVGVAKPDPEIFTIAMKMSRSSPSETVHIGDLFEADVVGARRAGIHALLLDRDGFRPELDCERIDSLSDLPALVGKI